jgi:uncharacterized RDD family membrane protein YckC
VNTDALRYAGFWPRLGANLLDGLILLPLFALTTWGRSQFPLFDVYYFLPFILFQLFYNVCLVQRYGGTPGKLIVGIRIRRLNGEPVGYREPFLRYLPDFLFTILGWIGLISLALHRSGPEFLALPLINRIILKTELLPPWYVPLQRLQAIWDLGELIVLLTNQKKRAIHDFIAGTVVVHASPDSRR